MTASFRLEMLEYEGASLRQGKKLLAGVDEAGRGPLAGPVVAAAVSFPKSLLETLLKKSLSSEDEYLAQIDDSKKITPKRREMLFAALEADTRIAKGFGVIGEKVIDEVNIYQATILAMREALSQIQPAPDHVLVDGHSIPKLYSSQQGIFKGDQKSLSIAAASIIAKVIRDRIMTEYDAKYPQYNFRQHKGYGTADHLERIKRHGPSPIHRRSFSPVREQELFPRP